MSYLPYKVTALARSDNGDLNIIPGATVTVLNSTGGYATLREADFTTPIPNPFNCDENGERQIYLQGGSYTFSVDGGQSWEVRLSGASDIQSVATIADASALTGLIAGQILSVNEYSAGTNSGGGELVVTASADSPDAGTVFSSATGGVILKRRYPDVLTPLMFGADPTNPAVDDYAAFAAMLDVAENEDRAIFIPDCPNYFIDTPLTAYQGLRIAGLQEASAAPGDGGSGARIFAPNGFLSAASRMSVYISNLHIVGNNDAAIYGFDGPLGGVIQGCHTESFERLMSNNYAYFLTLLRNRWGESEIGIALAVANATEIIDNFFASDCKVKIDSGFTITTAFDGVTNVGGAPLNIRDCGFNINTTSGAVCIRHKGSGDISNNYFEVFANAGGGREIIHWQPRRNAYDTVKCNDNRVSNQGLCDRFLRLWSDNALGTVTSGEVKRNTVRGCTSKPFVFGDITSLANPLVSGINITDNNYDTADQIDHTSVYNYFSPQIQGSFSGSLSIAGATFANVPLSLDAGSSGGEAIGDDLYPRVSGHYSVVATVVVQTTASDYPDVQARLRKTGVVLDTARQSLTYNAATSYATLTMTASTAVTIADFFELQARQGETLISAKITIKRER